MIVGRSKNESLDDLVPDVENRTTRIEYLRATLATNKNPDVSAIVNALHAAARQKWNAEKPGAMIDAIRERQENFDFLPKLKSLLKKAQHQLRKVLIPELSPELFHIDALLQSGLFDTPAESVRLRRTSRGRPSKPWKSTAHSALRAAGIRSREDRDLILRAVDLLPWHEE